jgi:hypothetical protein
MKNIQKLCLLVLMSFFMLACNKENDSNELAYIGTWETSTIAFPINIAGELVNRKMECTFMTDSFAGTIKHMIGYIEEPLCYMKGSISNVNNNSFLVEITKLGYCYGSMAEWCDSSDASFDTIFVAFVESFMPAKFQAEYNIMDNELDLILSDPPDTIQLFKIL